MSTSESSPELSQQCPPSQTHHCLPNQPNPDPPQSTASCSKNVTTSSDTSKSYIQRTFDSFEFTVPNLVTVQDQTVQVDIGMLEEFKFFEYSHFIRYLYREPALVISCSLFLKDKPYPTVMKMCSPQIGLLTERINNYFLFMNHFQGTLTGGLLYVQYSLYMYTNICFVN